MVWFRDEQRRYEDQLDEVKKKNKVLEVIHSGYQDEVTRLKAVLNEQIRLRCEEVRKGEIDVSNNKEDSPLRKMKQYQTGVGGSPSPNKKIAQTTAPKLELKQVIFNEKRKVVKSRY